MDDDRFRRIPPRPYVEPGDEGAPEDLPDKKPKAPIDEGAPDAPSARDIYEGTHGSTSPLYGMPFIGRDGRPIYEKSAPGEDLASKRNLFTRLVSGEERRYPTFQDDALSFRAKPEDKFYLEKFFPHMDHELSGNYLHSLNLEELRGLESSLRYIYEREHSGLKNRIRNFFRSIFGGAEYRSRKRGMDTSYNKIIGRISEWRNLPGRPGQPGEERDVYKGF